MTLIQQQFDTQIYLHPTLGVDVHPHYFSDREHGQ